MASINISLNDFISERDTALVGRDYGKTLLTEITKKIGSLEKLHNNYDKIHIVIPKRIITMNKSFFLGFLEEEIKNLGKEQFLNKYVFEASEYIVSKVPSYADSALLSASMKEILHV